MSENYLQHAEHYYRIINAMNEAYAQAERQPYDGQRAGGGREGGQREYANRENGRAEVEARDSRDGRDGQEREPEFGEDPRGIDEGEAVSLDRPAGEPALNHAASRDGESDEGEGGEWSRPIRPRRRPPRPRRPAGGNGSSTEASEGPTEGGSD